MTVDLTQVLVALAIGLPATISSIATLWKVIQASKNLSTKVDENTAITAVGAAGATAAVSAATVAANKTELLNNKLDEVMAEKIHCIVKEHTDGPMKEIMKAIDELKGMKK